MSHLLRQHAPITDAAWRVIDDEARSRLTPALAARKLVDFSGPHGWEFSATNLGRTTPLAGAPADGVGALQRQVLAVVELRAAFTLARAELSDADRGAQDVDLAALDEAANRLASAENRVVFHGYDDAGITGIAQAATNEPITLVTTARHIRAMLPERSRRCCAQGSTAPTAWHSVPRHKCACWRRPNTAAIRCSTICARSSEGRSCGHPASRAPSS
jgi:uncharacterized linocin/CFP29 family protein